MSEIVEHEVRALSLRQPWAYLVVMGHKPVENRTWDTRYRGDFWIHAAKGMTKKEYEHVKAYAAERQVKIPEPQALKRGGIIGRAKLVDVVRPCAFSDYCRLHALGVEQCGHGVWHMPGQFGFMLENIVEVKFVPCQGALGFFRPQIFRASPNEKEPAAGG